MTQPTAATPPPEPARPSHRATGWIVAGVVVLVLLGVAGVGTLLAIGSGDGSEPTEPRAGATPTGSPTPGSDEFGPVPDLCEVDDHFAPVFDLVAKAEVVDDDELGGDGDLYQRSCEIQLADGSSLGHLRIDAAIHRSPQNAANDYRATSEVGGDYTESQEDIDADWEQAVVLLDEESDGASVRLVTLDGVLVLDLWCYLVGDASDIEAQQAALVQVADNLRAEMRR